MHYAFYVKTISKDFVTRQKYQERENSGVRKKDHVKRAIHYLLTKLKPQKCSKAFRTKETFKAKLRTSQREMLAKLQT